MRALVVWCPAAFSTDTLGCGGQCAHHPGGNGCPTVGSEAEWVSLCAGALHPARLLAPWAT